MEPRPSEEECLTRPKITICGTCGRLDTEAGHPPIGSPFVSCEYPYGLHNDKGAPGWLSRKSLQQMINHYTLEKLMAEERGKFLENTLKQGSIE
ncbi:hypothetical protein FBUS_00522 [Fasciolopsis buskii]|uniref:Uncharacterized protein n=1 Tax=Fasciolopsis buskii TaxID=27845 RepID=A0A8E0VNW0_9TREM|nr:hypothetical protein FBUS_00522 [Fasciolopsis buski]